MICIGSASPYTNGSMSSAELLIDNIVATLTTTTNLSMARRRSDHNCDEDDHDDDGEDDEGFVPALTSTSVGRLSQVFYKHVNDFYQSVNTQH